MFSKIEISIETKGDYLNGKRLIETITAFLMAEEMDIVTNESDDSETLFIMAEKRNQREVEHQGPMTKSEYLANSAYFDTIPI